MIAATLALAPAVVWDAIPPGWIVLGAFGILYAAFEARLHKAGFIKRDELNGQGTRLEEKIQHQANQQQATQHQVTAARTDLDATRDRVTRLEATGDAMAGGVESANKKLDAVLEGITSLGVTQAVHEQRLTQLERKEGR